MVVIALVPSPGTAQKVAKKLTEQNIIDLLTGDASSDDVAQEARKSGISFQVTATVANHIRAAGGTDELIRVLRSLAPHPPAPPVSTPHTGPAASPSVLVIDSSPGLSQVYVDDEPMGSTSKQGRLKLTQLAPGSHTVRISLNGYEDFEKTVTLTGGQVTTMAANLHQAVVAPEIPPVGPQPEEPPPANPSQAGYLGITPMQEQPAGARGVVISGAQPGGPAAQAGLKTYDTILAVNGRQVASPQDLRTSLASHQAGDVVQITWYNGTTNVTRQIRLTTPPGQESAQVIVPPTPIKIPRNGLVNFTVAHDHGQSGKEYCVGVMSIGNGMIHYKGVKGSNGVHNFDIPLNSVKEARRNGVYLKAIGAFHIRTRKGTNYNFVAINQQGQYQPPDPVLEAIDSARGR
jgi:hypothetical protein